MQQWLAGILTTLNGNASDFQAHSAKFTNSLSRVYLGREGLKKKLIVSSLPLLNAINTLASMVIEAQLEKLNGLVFWIQTSCDRFDQFFLNHRGLVETVIDQLKTICHIDHSRHRKPDNFIINLISGLMAYMLKPRKPALDLHTKISHEKLLMSS